MQTYHHEIAAVLIARVFLGLLFFVQGYDAVFKVKVKGVIDAISAPLSASRVPRFLIVLGAVFTSYVELIAGFFLIIGFVKYYSLYLLGIDLIVASIAFGISRPVWDLKFVFPRLALLLFLLIVPSQWDIFSVDYCWSLIRLLKSIGI
jgi:putative oxidoreductase